MAETTDMTPMAATFAFSDDELLDALTTIDDVSVGTLNDKTAAVMAAAAAIPPSAAEFSLATPHNTMLLLQHLDRTGPYATAVSTESLVTTTATPSAFALEPHDDTLPLAPADADGTAGGDVILDDETASTTGSSRIGDDDDDDGDSDSRPGGTTSRCASISASAPPKPSRKRRKHELDAMRALASSLEAQLAGLRQKHHQPEQPGANLFWKRVAEQLLLDRQRASTENARLRDIFQDQAKVLKSVQRTLLKSPDLAKLGVQEPAAPAVIEDIAPPDIYSKLFQEVATAYPSTETVFEKAGILQASDNSRRVNMDVQTTDGRSVMCMQVAESRTLPFDVSTVGEGVWQFLANSTCSGDGNENFQRLFKARGNDVFGVCKIGCSLGLFTLSADVAVRRYIDGNRLTYVWECQGRCDNDPCPSASFRLQEKGWVVFEPSPTDPSNKSVFRSCVQFIPQPMKPNEELGSAAKDIGLATEVALSVYERTIGHIYESVLGELMGEMSIST